MWDNRSRQKAALAIRGSFQVKVALFEYLRDRQVLADRYQKNEFHQSSDTLSRIARSQGAQHLLSAYGNYIAKRILWQTRQEVWLDQPTEFSIGSAWLL